MTWNTQPNFGKLAKIVPLFNELVKVSPNGHMLPLKVARAFAKVHAAKAIFDPKKKSLDELCDEASEQVRMLWKKFRELRHDEKLYERLIEKARTHMFGMVVPHPLPTQGTHAHTRNYARISPRAATQWHASTDIDTDTRTATNLACYCVCPSSLSFLSMRPRLSNVVG